MIFPESFEGVRVLNHLELESRLQRSGIGTAVSNQRKALAETDIAVTTGTGHFKTVARALTGRQSFADIDLVHCNMIGPETLSITEIARRTETPLILHAHVTAEDFAGSFRGSTRLAGPLGRYLRFLYSRADLVCCPSEQTKRYLSAYPVDTPVYPLTNGVDRSALQGYETLRARYRERFKLSGTVVFAVGNVFERKGVDTFCRLASASPYDFAWFGPYDHPPLVSETVSHWTQNPPENVTFTGWIDDIRGAYGAGDIYLFPTKSENQGIAVLEAMACGKPVVLRRLPVFEEYYTDGEDCLLCETKAEFQEALHRLHNDPELRRTLGTNAKETARAHSLEYVASELTTVYDAVNNGKPKRVLEGR